MTLRYRDERLSLHHGDCVEVLATLPDSSIDSIVTDPPYELGFMGRRWDASGIAYSVKLWSECLRVLKPGGHLLAFGGTRTYHRMTCAIEDAGFEIRDEIAWLYGSGFPKSLDVSKAIDKTRRRDYVLAAIDLGLTVPGNNLHDWTKAEHSPGDAWWEKFKAALPDGDWQRIERAVIAERSRASTGRMAQGDGGYAFGEDFADTASATDDAKRWDGWGTALKPAHEPIVVARKPLVGTVAGNVLAHGTGALNIDGCRVAMDDADRTAARVPMGDWTQSGTTGATASRNGRIFEPAAGGRWPTNVLLDEHAAAELDEQSGTLTSGANPTRRGSDKFQDTYGKFAGREECTPARGTDSGGASRFFPTFRYQAKAPSKERPKVDGVAHPTVKPLELMRWLVRLVTPPGGVVLDPFAGSGTTAQAAALEGMACVTIELEAAHLPLIAQRLGIELVEPESAPEDRSAWTPERWMTHFLGESS